MTIASLTAFFGWMTILNLGLFVISAFFTLVLRDWAAGLHSRMFRIEKDKVIQIYFSFLGTYKIALIVLNLVPYLALRIIA